MNRWKTCRRALLVGAVVAVAASTHAGEPGSKLPEGAIARFGSTKLRHRCAITRIAYSPDGKTLASSDEEGGLRLWDAHTGNLVRALAGHEDAVTALAFANDGKVLATAGSDLRVRIWDLATGKQLHAFGDEPLPPAGDGKDPRNDAMAKLARAMTGASKAVLELALSADGKEIFAATKNTIQVLDAATGKVLRAVKGTAGPFALTPDGHSIAVNAGGKIDLRDLATGDVRRTFAGVAFKGPPVAEIFALSKDGKRLAIKALEIVVVYDLETGKELRRVTLEDESLGYSGFSPDLAFLAGVQLSGELRLYDTTSGKLLGKKPARDLPGSFVFAPDGKSFAAGGLNGIVHVQKVPGLEPIGVGDGHDQLVASVAFSADGKALLTASHDMTVRTWDLGTGKQRFVLKEAGGDALFGSVFAAFAPDGLTVASCGGGETRVRFVDVVTGAAVREVPFPGGFQGIACVGTTLVGVSPINGDMGAWPLEKGGDAKKRVGSFVVWAATGDRIALGVKGSIRVLALPSLDLVKTVQGWTDFVQALALSPDGATVAAGCGAEAVSVREVDSGKELAAFAAAGKVLALAFAPDGRRLACGLADGSVSIHDARSGKELHRFTGHGAAVTAASFSPDGKLLATASRDTTVLVWRVPAE